MQAKSSASTKTVRDYLVSVPERIVRSLTAISAGLVRETGDVVLPAFVRRSRLYSNLVDSTLRFLIEQVGQVENAYPAGNALPSDFIVRRTAGNALEVAGVVAFRASPVWVLAALADVSGAGRHLVAEIAAELQREKLLDPGETFDTVDQILDGLEHTSARLAEACNTPPLDAASLRAEWTAFRQDVARFPVPDTSTVAELWGKLRNEAGRQEKTVFELSAILAVSAVRRFGKGSLLAVRRTGGVVAEATLGHYAASLAEINRTGWFRYWIHEFSPYFRAAAEQFSPTRRTFTQRLLRRGQ